MFGSLKDQKLLFGHDTVELTDDLAEGFKSFFRQNPPSFAKKIESTTMTVGGKRFNYDSFASIEKLFDLQSVLTHNLTDWAKQEPHERTEVFVKFVEEHYRQGLVEREHLKQKLHDKINGDSKDFDLPDPDFIIDTLRPVRVLGDVRRESGFRFIDKRTKLMTDYDYHSVVYSLRRKLPRESVEEFVNHHVHIRERYHPYEPTGIAKEEESNNVYTYNRYTPPAWKSIDVPPKLDEDIEVLFSHLFPDERDREFVCTWIYHSLTSRAGTYLYLCGGKGCGKNTLGQLITRLHGTHNTSVPKQSSLTRTQFNYFLKDKTFVYFDEYSCRNRQDKNMLKTIVNNRIQVEGKHRDHEDIEVFSSFLMSANMIDEVGIEPDDRRFSVPNCSWVNIVDVMSRDWIRDLQAKFEDDTYIAQFGHWILQEYANHKFFAEEPLITDRYEEIVHATARIGCAETLQKVLRREQLEYDYNDEKESFRRVYKGQTFPGSADWQKFFSQVTANGKPLGTIKGTRFFPREDYRPQGVSREGGLR